MKFIHSPLHSLHDGGKELHRGELVPCYEMPARVDYILSAIARAGWVVEAPGDYDDALLERVHDADYIAFLRGAHEAWRAEGRDGFMLPGAFPARGMRRDRVPAGLHARLGYYAFDAGSPIVEGTWRAARASAHCALAAADAVLAGERGAYALCRPPGHHAGHAMFGGYCFLNNAALAAQRLRDGGLERVAVLDVDYHHGNGTQDIFWERDDVLCMSIHGDPDTEYPFYLGYADERGAGAGEGFNQNYPLPRGTDWAAYAATLDRVLERLAAYAPQALVVSLGVDVFEGDPISQFRLGSDDFPRLGQRIAALGLPTVLVQEGGYAVAEIGDNVAGVLSAFA
ncbi:acetylpolyamine aminohydrolase [Lysobacter arseniciresistens ZS79]|uniref:Acetylpolyamine aminohydrolase n=1 Tax=Lysobacter arseniciresistens ZS79 TaxID=913325 RepID=A0A0A0F8K5_9GAMM|nr:histone deacetylase family protein [Lysobacter arseniciresistens]KGM57722.1 acetylpolyamine aminohydrolase [Lysobacter arseniciresistens ZS79]